MAGEELQLESEKVISNMKSPLKARARSSTGLLKEVGPGHYTSVVDLVTNNIV